MGNEQSVSLAEIWSHFWASRRLGAALIVCAIVLASFYAAMSPPKFRTTMVVRERTPLESDAPTSSNLSSLLGQPQVSELFIEFQDLLVSRAAFERVLQNQPDVIRAYAPNLWDEETNEWVPRTKLKRQLKCAFTILVGHPCVPQTVNGQYLKELIGGSIKITETEAWIVNLTILSQKKGPAQGILVALVSETNELIRDYRLKSTFGIEAALIEKIETTTVETSKSLFIEMLAKVSAEKVLMENPNPYVAVMLVPPYTDDSPASPNIPFIIVFSLGVAVLIWAISSTVLALRSEKSV